jgi:N-acyl-D-amino-acid deacylase
MLRSSLARLATAVIAAGAAFAPAALQAQVAADLLLRRGLVVDGTGAAPRVADVAIRGDRIVLIGDATRAGVRATRTIDVSGLVVAPGFIDPHTHTEGDLSSAERRGNVDFLMQGVTTVITGNDGGGPIDVGRVLAGWEKNGIGTNAALLVGEGSVRQRLLGMQGRAPTAAELDSMRRLVAKAMDEGALGMSTGLYYAPQSYATTEEVIELAKVAAARGGVYDTHLRDESSYNIGLIAAVAEAIRIGREANLPVSISHIKALGTDVWGQSDTVIALIKAARSRGQDVFANQYPYTASGTSIGASLLPRWAESGGRDSLLARMNPGPVRDSLVRDMTNNMRRRGGPGALLVIGGRDRSIVGKNLAQIAAARGVSPIEAALQIIKNGGAAAASFNMKESDIERFMVQDFVATGSDGSDGHPRKYGTFPKKLREYVFTKHTLSLPDAIASSSARTARGFRIPDRGVLREGAFADVIAFDSTTVADRATYEQPELLSVGMKYVLVNGVLAVEDGKATGKLAGRALRRVDRP